MNGAAEQESDLLLGGPEHVFAEWIILGTERHGTERLIPGECIRAQAGAHVHIYSEFHTMCFPGLAIQTVMIYGTAVHIAIEPVSQPVVIPSAA